MCLCLCLCNGIICIHDAFERLLTVATIASILLKALYVCVLADSQVSLPTLQL